jgi:hypothetical protein
MWAVLVGCTSSSGSTVNVERNELGITHVAIDRQMTGADRLTEIHGFDARDQEVASLTLRVGDVRTSYDPGVAPNETSLGREIDVTAGSRTAHVVMPDVQVSVQPAFVYRAQNVFVTLSAVSAELDAEGLSFAVPPRGDGKVAFDYEANMNGGQTCSGIATGFPSSRGSCAQSYNFPWRTYSLGISGVDTVLVRDHSSNGVCRTSSGTTGCGAGIGACYYGPCGWANSQTYDYTYILEYASLSGPTTYDVILEYSRGQDALPSWPGVTAACNCMGCNSDGTATPSGCTHN